MWEVLGAGVCLFKPLSLSLSCWIWQLLPAWGYFQLNLSQFKWNKVKISMVEVALFEVLFSHRPVSHRRVSHRLWLYCCEWGGCMSLYHHRKFSWSSPALSKWKLVLFHQISAFWELENWIVKHGKLCPWISQKQLSRWLNSLVGEREPTLWVLAFFSKVLFVLLCGWVFGTLGGQKRALRPLKWMLRQLQATPWVLGVKPVSSGRAAGTPSYWAVCLCSTEGFLLSYWHP